MPTYPEYGDKTIKPQLQLYNPLDYLRLLYWVYFRPSLLRYYIRKVEPDLYSRKGWKMLLMVLRKYPVLRNLMIQAIILPFMLSGSFGISLSIFDFQFSWWKIALGAIEGVALGVASIVIGGVAYGLLYGMAFGVAVCIAGGITVSIAYCVAEYAAFGVIVFAAFGVIVSVAYGVAGGVAYGIAGGTVIIRLLPFYPLEFILAWMYWHRAAMHPKSAIVMLKKSPVFFDELQVICQPYLFRLLLLACQNDLGEGLRCIRYVAQNPFQSWAAQRTLRTLMEEPHEQAFDIIYRILTDPCFDEFHTEPTYPIAEKYIPTVRVVLLAEVACLWTSTGRVIERVVWRTTNGLRWRGESEVTKLAGAYYDLLTNQPNLAELLPTFEATRQKRHGEEVYRSFQSISAFLDHKDLAEISQASEKLTWMKSLPEPPLRPKVLEVLRRLGGIAQEISVYQHASSRGSQASALLRAYERLDKLGRFIESELHEPERKLLVAVVEQWRLIIASEGGKVGERELKEPIDTPYVAGNPVSGELFVGRQDIFRRIEELWAGSVEYAVVLYGHRRMGKSSILRNLGVHFGGDTMLVYFDMQRVGIVQNTAELLFNAALEIYDALEEAGMSGLTEPQLADFTKSWSGGFNAFLRRVEKVLSSKRLVFAIDEFELIEQNIADGIVEERFLVYLRGLIQGVDWLTLAFAGLHTLHGMTKDYWFPFYGSVEMIKVSYLSHAAAKELIENPTDDFIIDYEPEATTLIIELTNGQPYLVQLVCHCLVTRLNHLIFDEEQEREPRIGVEDVKAVLQEDFFDRGNYYFSGVWGQAKEDERRILQVMAGGTEVWNLAELQTAAELDHAALEMALEKLEQHDVLRRETDENGITRWRFQVPLMRQWVNDVYNADSPI